MNGPNNEPNPRYLWFGIPIGTGFGVALGIVMATILDHPGFFALGIAIGTTLGITIGLALDQDRSK